VLEFDRVSVGYRDLTVIHGVSFRVGDGEVVSLVGSNGAGKSTILRAVSGLLKPTQGEIRLRGEAIHRIPAYEIVKKRVAMVPEGRQLFGRLSVLDNLIMGAYTLTSKQQVAESLEEVLALFPILRDRRDQRAETLSGGEQQQLAIARGLMSRPELLLLDEPSLGIMPKLVAEIFQTIREIRTKGITVLLVEQNVFEALEVADRAYVLQTGRIVLEGPGSELLRSDLVRGAYLGASALGGAEAPTPRGTGSA
jgi:branched-chain amino acid transport system ATP-binding protein